MAAQFKFPCPACRQPIQGNTQDCGSKIKCPTCQAEVDVPQLDLAMKLHYSRADHTVPVPQHASAAPRAAGAVTPPPPPPPMCRLAVTSFWLSLSSLIIWPFGFIPGIICAHKARAKIEKSPPLGGRQLAKLALVMGYGFAVVFGVAVVFVVLHFNASRKSQEPGEEWVQSSELVGPAKTNVPTVVEATQTAVGWTLDLTNMTIPRSPAAGKIHGRDFKPSVAGAGSDILALHQGTNRPHALSLLLFFRQKLPGESLSGKVFEAGADADSPLREVRIGWVEGQGEKVWQHFTNGYALRLKFGKVVKNTGTGTNTMAGSIYLCLPDTNYSYIAGRFDANVVKPRAVVTPPGAKQGSQPSPQPGAQPGTKKGKKGKKKG
jgi:hypothetical protein